MMFPKQKPIRLHGEALRRLVSEVFERDNHSCIICGRFVEDGVKPHHEPPGAGRKSDELNKMVLLCNECHYQRHHGLHSGEIKEMCEAYLGGEECGILN